MMNRKIFINKLTLATIGGTAILSSPFGLTGCSKAENELFFKLSLAQWSLHKTYFGDSLQSGFANFGQTLQNNPEDLLQGTEDPLYFAQYAREKFDINAIEYVNTFYFDKAENQQYLNELKNVADNEGVRSVLIMCDAEGNLGDPDTEARTQAIENHYKWVDMAKFLGCHSIRVNAASEGSYEEQMERSADGLRSISEYAASEDINIIVENHGGLSSNAEWLVDTIRMVDLPNCGTLPDFGNFTISEDEQYDNYKGTEEMMEFAFGVSAKTNVFDEDGNEAVLDYERLMQIVKDAGYNEYVGIEFEGAEMSEDEGIIATKELLEKVGENLS
ncbi:MAG: sugar phosphate isomerase/epimerase family protein [Balneolaceae bacterium]